MYVSSFVASESEPNDWGPASDASADLAIPGSAASLDDWTGSASNTQDDLFAGQSADVLADSALTNSLDDEAARRLNAELSILA